MLIPAKDSLPLFVTPGRCRAVVKLEFVDDGLRMACGANYPRHSIQFRPSGPKWMPVFLLQLTVPPQNHRPTLPRTETLIFPSYSVVEPLFVRAMMRLKFDCCYPVNSTTGFQRSHANVFTRCRKPNCFMPPDAMKRKKRTRACVLVVSQKCRCGIQRAVSHPHLRNIIGLHTSNLPPSRYIPSNSQSHTTDTEPTVYLTSESAVTRR